MAPAGHGRIDHPQSVRVAIQSRIAELDDFVQEVLGLAAVLGREFDFDTLAEAGNWEEESLIDALEQSEGAQLIEEISSERGATFAFAHALIPSTLLEGLSGLRQRRLHRQVAQVIEEIRPDDWAALAHHYSLAQDKDKALKYLTQAGDKARDQFAHEDALRFYNQALEFAQLDTDRFDLIEKRVAVFNLAADRESELAGIEELSDLAVALDNEYRRIDALLALANYFLETEHLKALEPAQQAAEIAREVDDPVREARALHLSGSVYWFSSQYKPSREDLEVAAQRFLDAGMPGEAAASLHMLSMALSELGDNAAGMEKVEMALDVSREAGDQLQEATSLRRLAIAYINDNKYSQALPYAKDALALHQQLGDRSEEMNALNVLGIIYMNLGESEKAEVHLRDSLALAEEIEANTGIQFAIFNLSGNCVMNGQYEQAILLLNEQIKKYDDSLDLWLVSGLYWNRALGYWLIGDLDRALQDNRYSQDILGDSEPAEQKVGKLSIDVRIYAELGDLEQAWMHMRTAEELAGNSDQLNQRVSLTIARSVLYWYGDDPEQGLTAVDEAIDAIRASQIKFMLAYALNLKARFYLALQQPGKALLVFDESVQLIERPAIHFRPQLYWYTKFLTLQELGRDAEAREALKRAYDWVKHVTDTTENEHLRRCWLDNIPDNGRILDEAKALGIAV